MDFKAKENLIWMLKILDKAIKKLKTDNSLPKNIKIK